MLIYVIRDPVDRLVSHYIHERSVGRVNSELREAIAAVPDLIDFGLYARQLDPYFEAFGPRSILPVFFARLARDPQSELERIGRFLGHPGGLVWDRELRPQNVGRERLRDVASPPGAGAGPDPDSDPAAADSACPVRADQGPLADQGRAAGPRPELLAELHARFHPDLARLGDWLGVRLDCQNFIRVDRGASARLGGMRATLGHRIGRALRARQGFSTEVPAQAGQTARQHRGDREEPERADPPPRVHHHELLNRPGIKVQAIREVGRPTEPGEAGRGVERQVEEEVNPADRAFGSPRSRVFRLDRPG